MSVPRHSIEQTERTYFLSQMADTRFSGAVTAITPANTALIEIPYLGRTHGAVQLYSTDGGAFVATFRIDGTLLSGNLASQNVGAVGVGYPTFLTASNDIDYIPVTPVGAGAPTFSAAGIYQLPFGYSFARIRVVCTAYTSGNPGIRVL